MRGAGEVVFAKVFATEQNLSRGCGVVEYATAAEAKNAQLTLHDTMLGDRKIFVREDREDKEVRPAGSRGRGAPRGSFRGGDRRGGDRRGGDRRGGHSSYSDRGEGVKVVVSGLPPTTPWQDLKDYFKRHGPVSHADVSRTGEGYVIFVNAPDAQNAIEKLNGAAFRGQTLAVHLA